MLPDKLMPGQVHAQAAGQVTLTDLSLLSGIVPAAKGPAQDHSSRATCRQTAVKVHLVRAI